MHIEANIPGTGFAHIEIRGERISSVRVLGPAEREKPFVSPGFVDLQLNGFAGVDFSDPNLDPEKAISVLPSVWKTGVTTFCPTLITNSYEQLSRNFRILEDARRMDPRFAWSVPGYHLEGPYLSPGEAHGVHDPRLMRHPDWDGFRKLQEAAGGRIRILTLAPELPGALDFIYRAHDAEVVVALGHTEATPEQIHLAVKAGAKLSTHLGNGCPQFIHRHRAPLWAQLANDQLDATIICDTFHLPPELVKVILRVKGIDRCILITDAVHVATLPPGRYSIVGTPIELLPSGQVVTLDQRSMAGSALSMNRALAVFMQFAGVPLPDAIRAATANPARLLRSHEICSQVAEGQPANLTLFRDDLQCFEIEGLVAKGEAIYLRERRSYTDALKFGR